MVRAAALLLLLAACEKSSSGTPEPSRMPERRTGDGVTTIELDLPRSATGAQSESKLVVTMDRDRNVYIGARRVALAEVPAAIAEIVRTGRDEVWVEADEKLPYGAFVQLIDALREGGMRRFQIITARTRPVPPGGP